MSKIVWIFYLLFNISFILIADNIVWIFTFSFYFYIIMLLLDIYKKKKLLLIHLWIIAFVFIILSEGIVFNSEISRLGNTGLFTSRLLLLANSLVIIGYLLGNFKSRQIYAAYIRPRKYTYIALMLIVIFYFSFSFSAAMKMFVLGRNAVFEERGNQVAWVKVIESLGMILPAFIAYYFRSSRKSNNTLIILSCLPVFIILFLSGTRYPLLFSLLGYLLVSVNVEALQFKTLFKRIVPAFFALIGFTQFMVSVRTFGSDSLINAGHKQSENIPNIDPVTSFIASKMSPEGIIQAFSKMVDYMDFHPFLLGKSTGFVLYFWVPRVVWTEKPTMLGSWMIRATSDGFGRFHSASYGFCGDFYADFGVPGALLLSFLLGFGLKKLEAVKAVLYSSEGVGMIIAAMMYPYVFFSVRSPITSTIAFLGILFTYSALSLLFIKINDVNNGKEHILST
ncbi:MAG: hypothetical protein WC156_04180 [Pedobacter sp.]